MKIVTIRKQKIFKEEHFKFSLKIKIFKRQTFKYLISYFSAYLDSNGICFDPIHLTMKEIDEGLEKTRLVFFH